jgi:hypothetical protein
VFIHFAFSLLPTKCNVDKSKVRKGHTRRHVPCCSPKSPKNTTTQRLTLMGIPREPKEAQNPKCQGGERGGEEKGKNHGRPMRQRPARGIARHHEGITQTRDGFGSSMWTLRCA